MGIIMKRELLWYVRRILLVGVIICQAFLSACREKDGIKLAGSAGSHTSVPGDGQVKVTFFDVGKGDAVFIETAGHCMLIDSGYDETAEVILDYMEEHNLSVVDYLVLTHFDKDHVGGADQVIGNAEIKTVLQPDYESDSSQYQEYTEAMEEGKISPVAVTETMELSLDGVDFMIDPPRQKTYKEENDFSLVVSMACNEVRFLFAGDCERERLDELLEQKEFPLSHDVLKVPHHGRKEKNSEEFLRCVSPAAAVITHMEGEMGDGKVCRILEEMGAEIYFTGNGTVTCLCDGKQIQMFQGKESD